jgi:hypothetical protein
MPLRVPDPSGSLDLNYKLGEHGRAQTGQYALIDADIARVTVTRPELSFCTRRRRTAAIALLRRSVRSDRARTESGAHARR